MHKNAPSSSGSAYADVKSFRIFRRMEAYSNCNTNLLAGYRCITCSCTTFCGAYAVYMSAKIENNPELS